MSLPTHPVTLEVQQIEELARHFSSFRHDVNGCLSLVIAATELIRYNPDVIRRMGATLVEQPPRIAGKLREFVEECERTLGLRTAAENSWYRDTWKRNNAPPGEPAAAVTLSAETAKALHNEVLQLGKELMQLGFIVSGARVLAAGAADVSLTAAEQLPKVTRKLDQLATALEQALGIATPEPRRIAGGSPAGPLTLSPDHIALFQRRLANLEGDVAEHLGPLLELSRLVRGNPREIPARSAEFAQPPPRINAVLTNFAADFDRTFGIIRAVA